MNPQEILQVMDARGAIVKGHFRLASGRHSDTFVQKFRVLEHPRLAQRFGESIAAAFEHAFDVVAVPAVGAIVLGFAAAHAADARLVFAERDEGVMRFRRGFRIEPHERALVIEDVVTTGGSAREVLDLVRASQGNPVGLGTLLHRGSTELSFGVPFKPLVRMEIASWSAHDCPFCAAGEPVEDPGSSRLNA